MPLPGQHPVEIADPNVRSAAQQSTQDRRLGALERESGSPLPHVFGSLTSNSGALADSTWVMAALADTEDTFAMNAAGVVTLNRNGLWQLSWQIQFSNPNNGGNVFRGKVEKTPAGGGTPVSISYDHRPGMTASWARLVGHSEIIRASVNETLRLWGMHGGGDPTTVLLSGGTYLKATWIGP